MYDLFGVVNHLGGETVKSGHYVAFAKNGNTWLEFNDKTVSAIPNEANLVPTAAYVLFYKRRNSQQQPAGENMRVDNAAAGFGQPQAKPAPAARQQKGTDDEDAAVQKAIADSLLAQKS